MSLFAWSLGALTWLPGHLLFELAVAEDSSVRRWPTVETLFVKLSISWMLIAWVAVTLAEVGYLRRWWLIAGVALLTVIPAVLLKARGRALWSSFSIRLDSGLAIVAGLTIASALWYVPGFEQVIGGRDPTTYVLTGVATARTGSFAAADPLIARLPESAWPDFLGVDYRETLAHYGPRFLGWYLVDPDTGWTIPQGFTLYPSLLAVGYFLGDIGGVLGATRILAIVSVVALFFLGRRLFGQPAGIAAAAMLLVSPAQVWFSRYATSEAIAQPLILSALYGLVVYRSRRVPAFGFLAALGFGLAWQAHIWTIWLVLPLFGMLVADLLHDRLERLDVAAFWGPLSVLGVHALLMYAVFQRPYLRGIWEVLEDSPWALAPLVPAVAALLAVCWRWGRIRSRQQDVAADLAAGALESVGWLRRSAAATVFMLAVYGYWIRPAIASTWRAEAIPRLALATSAVVFWLAIGAAVLLLIDRKSDDAELACVAITLGLCIPIFVYPSIGPRLMWSLRRYHTILPLVFLFAAAGLWLLTERVRRRRPGGWAARSLLAVSVAAAGALTGNLALLGIEYRGFKEPGEAVAAVDAIAASVEDNAVLIFESRSGWRVLDFAAPLAYWKGLDVVWLRRKETDPDVFLDFVRRQAQRGRPVYYFTQGFNYFIPAPRMEPHRKWWFGHQELEQLRLELPHEVLYNRIPFSSYRVLPGGSSPLLEGQLDVGEWDDNYVGEMFPREYTGEATARWTKGTAYAWLPGLEAGVARIIVRAVTFNDPTTPPRMLSATLDGVFLGEIATEAVWRDYVFDVPSSWQPTESSVPRLVLDTEPLRPDDVLGNGDTRYLGIQVDTIAWQ